ncbi:MAG: BON domain-containing protein [Chitinophagaceae bacterium]|nr:BON domain-containing protein [Oligoflexus sp.]
MLKFHGKADAQLIEDCKNELSWDPRVTANDITVTAIDGIVTLTGEVPHFIEKSMAEQAIQRVGGVRAVADELKVNLTGVLSKTDEEIATAAKTALEWNFSVPEDVKVSVERGWITLRGQVEWNFERVAAKNAVSSLLGVIGVSNDMTVKSKVQPVDVKAKIESAFKRLADSEAKNIGVSVSGDEVTLSGNVHSMQEKEDARTAAWSAPGVRRVQNDITVSM